MVLDVEVRCLKCSEWPIRPALSMHIKLSTLVSDSAVVDLCLIIDIVHSRGAREGFNRPYTLPVLQNQQAANIPPVSFVFQCSTPTPSPTRAATPAPTPMEGACRYVCTTSGEATDDEVPRRMSLSIDFSHVVRLKSGHGFICSPFTHLCRLTFCFQSSLEVEQEVWANVSINSGTTTTNGHQIVVSQDESLVRAEFFANASNECQRICSPTYRPRWMSSPLVTFADPCRGLRMTTVPHREHKSATRSGATKFRFPREVRANHEVLSGSLLNAITVDCNTHLDVS